MDFSTSRYAPTGEQKLTTSSAGGEASSDSLKSYLHRAKFNLDSLTVTLKPNSKALPKPAPQSNAKPAPVGASLSSRTAQSAPSAPFTTPQLIDPSSNLAPSAVDAEGKTTSAYHSVAVRKASFQAAVHHKAAEASKEALLRPDEPVKIPRRTSSFNPLAKEWSPQSQSSSPVAHSQGSSVPQAKPGSSPDASLPISALPFTLRSSSLQPSAVIAPTDMGGPHGNGLRGGTGGLSSSKYASDQSQPSATNSSTGLTSSRYATNQPQCTSTNSSRSGLASSRYATMEPQPAVRGGYGGGHQSFRPSSSSPFSDLGNKMDHAAFPPAANTGNWAVNLQSAFSQQHRSDDNVAPSQETPRTGMVRGSNQPDVDGMFSGFATLRSNDQGGNSEIKPSNEARANDITMVDGDIADPSMNGPPCKRARAKIQKNFLTSIQTSIMRGQIKQEQEAAVTKKKIDEKIRALDAVQMTSGGQNDIYASERARHEAVRSHQSHDDRLQGFRGFLDPQPYALDVSYSTPSLPALSTSFTTPIAPMTSQRMATMEVDHDEEMTDVSQVDDIQLGTSRFQIHSTPHATTVPLIQPPVTEQVPEATMSECTMMGGSQPQPVEPAHVFQSAQAVGLGVYQPQPVQEPPFQTTISGIEEESQPVQQLYFQAVLPAITQEPQPVQELRIQSADSATKQEPQPVQEHHVQTASPTIEQESQPLEHAEVIQPSQVAKQAISHSSSTGDEDTTATSEAQVLTIRANQDIEACNKVSIELFKIKSEHERRQASLLEKLKEVEAQSNSLEDILAKNKAATKEATGASTGLEKEVEMQSKKYKGLLQELVVLSKEEMDAIKSGNLADKLGLFTTERIRITSEISTVFQAKDQAQKSCDEQVSRIEELSKELDANKEKSAAVNMEGHVLWNTIVETETDFAIKQKVAEDYVICTRQDVIGVVVRVAELLGLYMPAERYIELGLSDDELQAFYIVATPRERVVMDLLAAATDEEYAAVQASGGSKWAKGHVVATDVETRRVITEESLPNEDEVTVPIALPAVRALRNGQRHKRIDSTESLNKAMAELTIDKRKTADATVETKNQIFFKAWPKPETRDGGPSQIRRVKINGLPSTANLNKVVALVWGGKVQKFLYVPGCSTAEILFLKHEDAMSYYKNTSNGIEYPGQSSLWILPTLYSDVDPVFEFVEGMIQRGDTRVLRVLNIEKEWTTAALGKVAQGMRRTLQVEKVSKGQDRYGRRFVEFHMGGIQDAIVLKAELERNPEWEGTTIQFGEDPCETAKGVRLE